MSTTTENSNHTGKSGSYGGASFAPVSYDVEQIEPDAYAGAYEGTIDRVQFKLTQKTGQPMIVVDWKLMSTEDESEECQKSVGSTVTDWIVLANDKSGNRGKIKLRVLRDTLGLDPDVLPTQISSFDDLKDLAVALKGQTMPVWVSTNTDNDGNVRTNINYAAPRGAGGMAPMGDEEAEEAPKATKGKATKAAPAKGAAAKRR